MLLARSVERLQLLFDSVDAFCSANGLRISLAKTQVMFVNCAGSVCVRGTVLTEVSSFKYLGVLLRVDASVPHTRSIAQATARLAAARSGFHAV